MKLIFLLALFVTSPLLCMELATPSQILLQPDIIKLIAYALVNTTEPDSLVDHSSYSRKADKQLLVVLRNFSATNKKIHDIIHNLRCGVTQEAVRFNCHFYTRMGGHVTTAAFMGTPWALNIVLDTCFKELETKYDKKTAIKELNKQLGARSKHVRRYQNVDVAKLPPHYCGQRPSIMTGYFDYESITKTMLKFPPSTRQFILKLIA